MNLILENSNYRDFCTDVSQLFDKIPEFKS